jgi:hypothetical protein
MIKNEALAALVAKFLDDPIYRKACAMECLSANGGYRLRKTYEENRNLRKQLERDAMSKAQHKLYHDTLAAAEEAHA